ncbi:MAG: hypothetical protein K9G46_00650 [Flavobacteriales bacterium]|nr:hypothetical protein [Flavobacteriales bacterium]
MKSLDGLKMETKKHRVEELPVILNNGNIQKTIDDYYKFLQLVQIDEIRTHLGGMDAIGMFHELKRGVVKDGPYFEISIFEAANRIMTDLTILFGIQELLFHERLSEYKNYRVEFGNGNKQLFDIHSDSTRGGRRLVGEAFNVAPSYFHTKKSQELTKLRKYKQPSDFILLLFNQDAFTERTTLVNTEFELHLAVDVEKKHKQFNPAPV